MSWAEEIWNLDEQLYMNENVSHLCLSLVILDNAWTCFKMHHQWIYPHFRARRQQMFDMRDGKLGHC